jgi:CRISPR/Cas system-associated exonuclease Cas4 (RecB family)
MTLLSDDFQFSQGSLQDYVECRRRFQLRHLWNLAWPAEPAEPAEEYEQHVLEGDAFHHMLHQHQLGLPVDAGLSPESGALAVWWQNYLAQGPRNLPPVRHPEVTLSAEIAGYRLVAKYDLVAVDPGKRAVIVDWKTGRGRPSAAKLAARLQTRVYRYLLVTAGAAVNRGLPFAPEQVAMLYWFAAHPNRPERISYDTPHFEADQRYLTALVQEIEAAGPDDFPKTDDEGRCRFCAYRSLCERGVTAGDIHSDPEAVPEESDVPDDDFAWEQIGEIAF